MKGRSFDAYRTLAGWALAGIMLLVLVAVPRLIESYYLTITTRILIMALFAVAFNVVFGMAGLPAFGHATFFGVGGYVIGLSFLHWELSFWQMAVMIVVSCAALGALFGFITRKVEGLYMFLLTLALAQAIWGLGFQQVRYTRGDNGIAGITRDTIPFFPPDSIGFYYFILSVVAVSVLLLWVFSRSPVGRAIVGVRESPTRMAAMGYNVALYRNIAFQISAVFSGVAGALFVYNSRFVQPDILSWSTTATVWIMAILGGTRTFFGPIVGAVSIIVLENWISGRTDRWLTVLGLIFIITITFLPDGIVGRLSRLTGRRSRWDGDPDAELGDAPAAARDVPEAGRA